MLSQRKRAALLMSLSMILIAGGCKKKVPPPPPPPPAPVEQPKPEPPKPPTISQFTAEPTTIQRGQSATLHWVVMDATDVSIDNGIGAVQASGTRTVFPSSTTRYTLTAKGAGGDTTASASVNVTAPPPPPAPPPAPPKATLSERIQNELSDAFFDYDKSDVRDDARASLTKDADVLKAIFNDFPSATIVIEGHCDERGTAEYNLGLGDRRSTSAKEFLTQLGVPGDKLRTITYGKERPQCTESTEECWQKNRRAHFAPAQ
jgi:peptidoglycan-associated lipoprotein